MFEEEETEVEAEEAAAKVEAGEAEDEGGEIERGGGGRAEEEKLSAELRPLLLVMGEEASDENDAQGGLLVH